MRDYGGYGVGDELFEPRRYDELNYPAAMDAFDPNLPVHLFIAVGDDEWPNPDPTEAQHDIDFESARLYNTARRVAGITAELRILDGGHDWDVWQPAFREGIIDVSGYLHVAAVEPWSAELVGTTGVDTAGGLTVAADGAVTLAVNTDGMIDEEPTVGGLDVVVVQRDAAGEDAWTQRLATAADDRAYGLDAGADGGSSSLATRRATSMSRGSRPTATIRSSPRSTPAARRSGGAVRRLRGR